MGIYGIKRGTSGVYMLTNTINGKRYIGSSKDISARLSTHFGRDSKKYPNHPLYADVLLYGRESFDWIVLEECENLLEREQFYFDTLKPEYNTIRPNECSFYDPLVRELSKTSCKTKRIWENLKVLYSTKEYKTLFKSFQKHRMKRIIMCGQGLEITFESFMDCQRWLNENTSFVGKNKASKIKAVCDGERKSAYGFTFKYEEV